MLSPKAMASNKPPEPHGTIAFCKCECGNEWVRTDSKRGVCRICYKEPAVAHFFEISSGIVYGSAFYKCECGKEWVKRDSRNKDDTCPKCAKDPVHPYNFERRKRRMFGRFACECGNTWSSGYTWEGMGQQCEDCKEMILPHILRPLRPSKAKGSGGGVHKEELCQMCQQQGQNCQEVTDDQDSGDFGSDDDDAQSVVSTVSTVSDVSTGTLTPTEGSGEEDTSSGSDTEDGLADYLSQLTIPNKRKGKKDRYNFRVD